MLVVLHFALQCVSLWLINNLLSGQTLSVGGSCQWPRRNVTVTFAVLTAVTIKNFLVWDVKPGSLVEMLPM